MAHLAVEEAIAAGITEMIFVTGRSKRAIEDHFDKSYEIEAELEARGKEALLEVVRNIKPANVDCFYVRQPTALGLGHAVLCAEKLIGENPFAVILADDLLHSKEPVMKQLVDVFNHYHSSVIGVERISRIDSGSYGVIEGREWEEDIIKLSGIVEKPQPALAPSNLGVVGRYVFMPGIFTHLRNTRAGSGGEIQLTDAMIALSRTQNFYGLKFEGRSFDCGSKIGFLAANVSYALAREDIAPGFRAEIKKIIGENGA